MNTPLLSQTQEDNAPWNDDCEYVAVDVTAYYWRTDDTLACVDITVNTYSEDDLMNEVEAKLIDQFEDFDEVERLEYDSTLFD